MNHKRRRPKNSRAGCLMCKPHKGNGMHREKTSVTRVLQTGRLERADARSGWHPTYPEGKEAA